MASLPTDVWFVIVSYIDDPKTLHSLAMSCKSLWMALPKLYDVQRIDPNLRPWSEDADDRVFRWSQFWRSITLSATPGRTAYPYARYLKVWDVLELEAFLESIVRDKPARQEFFANQNDAFTKTTTFKLQEVTRLTNEITAHVLPQCVNVEEISREPTNTFLDERVEHFTRWLSLLPKLRILRVFDGDTLTRSIRQLLQEKCPALVDLDIYLFRELNLKDIDEHVSSILTEIQRPWRSCTLRSCKIGNKTLRALADQCDTLTHLELWSYKAGEVLEWGKLAACHKLETLALIDFHLPPELDTAWTMPFTHFLHGPFRHLRQLNLDGVSHAMALSTTQLMTHSTLRELRIRINQEERVLRADTVQDANVEIEAFGSGLAQQRDLTDLELVLTIPEEFATHAATVLAASIRQLTQLRNLQLGSSAGPCAFFNDEHFQSFEPLAQSLESLKVASFTLSKDALLVLQDFKKLSVFECMVPCYVTEQDMLQLVQKNEALVNVLFVGDLSVEKRGEIDGVLAARDGHFTNFAPYVPRGGYGAASDSDEDEDYEYLGEEN